MSELASPNPEIPAGHYYVACPHCQGVFLIPGQSEGMGVQCPFCSALTTVPPPHPDGLPAMAREVAGGVGGADRQLSEGHSRTDLPSATWLSHEEEEAIKQKIRWKRQGVVIVGLGLVIAVIGAISLWRTVGRSAGAPAVDASKDPQRIETERRAMEARELASAWEVAEKFFLAPNWPQTLPYVRHSERVQKLMEAHYGGAARGWKTYRTEEKTPGRVFEQEGLLFAEVGVYEGASPVTLRLEKTPRGYRADWEAFVDLASVEWESFYSMKSTGSTVRVRCHILRGSVPESWYQKAGTSEAQSVAVRFHGPNAGDSVYAAVPKGSPLLTQLGALSHEHPLFWIVELEMADAQAVPPRVTLHSLYQQGWIYKE